VYFSTEGINWEIWEKSRVW